MDERNKPIRLERRPNVWPSPVSVDALLLAYDEVGKLKEAHALRYGETLKSATE